MTGRHRGPIDPLILAAAGIVILGLIAALYLILTALV